MEDTKQKNEKPLLVIEYKPLGRIGALMLRIFAVILGLFFLLANNYFANFFGIFFILIFVLDFFNITLFDRLVFYDDALVKESSIFNNSYTRKLKYHEAEVMISGAFFGGTLMFWEKGRRWKTAWFFTFDLLPISNNEIRAIKQILIEKQVIKGDEHEWNY